jgi:hypothetical protein
MRLGFGLGLTRRSGVGGDAPAFDPNAVVDLISGFNPLNEASITEVAGAVSEISDASPGGTNHYVQTSGSRQPSVSDINGVSALAFAREDHLEITQIDMTGTTFILVLEITEWGMLWGQSDTNQFTAFFALEDAFDARYFRERYGPPPCLTPFGAPLNDPQILCVNHGVGSLDIHYAGQSASFPTVNGGAEVGPLGNVFNSKNITRNGAGKMGFFGVYPELTNSQINSICTSLATAYGLTWSDIS